MKFKELRNNKKFRLALIIVLLLIAAYLLYSMY